MLVIIYKLNQSHSVITVRITQLLFPLSAHQNIPLFLYLPRLINYSTIRFVTGRPTRVDIQATSQISEGLTKISAAILWTVCV